MNFLHIPVWFQKRHLLLKKKKSQTASEGGTTRAEILSSTRHKSLCSLIVSQLNAASSETDK